MTQPEFGIRLREARQRKGLSQTDLSGEGLTNSYISLLEAGRRQASHKVVSALAERLGVDVEFLLSGQDRPLRQERELELRFAELALFNGDPREARTVLERLLRTAPDAAESWTVEYHLARAHERCGDLEAAIEILEGLRERAGQDPARWPWLQVVTDLSRCYREAGDLTRAIEVAERAVDRARQLGLSETRDLPRLVVTLAAASVERGDRSYASQLLNRLLRDLGVEATRRDRGSALWEASILAADRGDFAEGVLLAERALAQFAEEEDVRADGLLRTTLAWILLESPDHQPHRAFDLLSDAHRRLTDAGMEIEVAYTETELARVSVELGQHGDAIRWAQRALERLGDKDRLESARARLALARAFLAQGEHAIAVAEMTAAAAALEGLSAGRQAASAWRELADLFAAVGDVEASRVALSVALDLVGVRGAPSRSPHQISPAGGEADGRAVLSDADAGGTT